MTQNHAYFKLNAKDCICMLIDVQDSLFKAVQDNKIIEMNMRLLLRLGSILNIPLLVTTQNAPKLGPTIPILSKIFPQNQKVHDKLVFSCLKVPTVVEELQNNDRKTLILFGIEAHICVYQTAIQALEQGYNVIVVADAVSSRTLDNKQIGLQRLRDSGVILLSTEMVIYELLGEAGTPIFRTMLPYLKDPTTI